MIKAAIFDLDSTLINTQKIKKIIFEFIKNISGLPDEKIIALYKSARNSGDKIDFSLRSLERELRNNSKNFSENKWEKFTKELQKPQKGLLIKGAQDIINFLKENNIPVYILTLGVPAWQQSKIRFSGLDKILGESVKNIKFTTEEDAERGKIKEIKEILQELNLSGCADILFFNDRPDETAKIMKAFPALKVFLRRENQDKRHTDEDFINLWKNKNIIKISEDLDLIRDIKKFL